MPAFTTLWGNHPNIKGDAPLLDKKTYPNQCAVNLAAALMRSGMDMKSFTGARSWEKDKPKYAIRAQELANWLATPAAQLPQKVQKLGAKKVFDGLYGKTGIIFFQNYWGVGNQGDHIDLWNGSRLTDWTSWVRIRAHIVMPGLWSDFEAADSVWFWWVP